MTEIEDFTEELNRRIEDIHKRVLSGELSLLDLKLEPIFIELKDSITVHNILRSSKTYKDACDLLYQKFEVLKNLLDSLDNEKKFFQYLKSNPDDLEISKLFDGCWVKTFTIDALSLNFLESCKDKLLGQKEKTNVIEHVDKVKVKGNFLLEISKHQFSERINDFFDSIKNKLPCPFDAIFEGERDQIKIYQNFVYLLHLLQSGRIKYQKETNFLYV